jgi:hypothetical protein
MSRDNHLLYGTYVGLVLDSQDPDDLGRVKLIVPGKTGPLFKGWNDRLDDISFKTASSDPFSPDVLDRLLGVLPWARPCTPVWGGGTGAPVATDTQKATTIPTDQALHASSNAGSNAAPTPGVLAKTGNSGHSTGAHLDVRWGDKNPIATADADKYLLIDGKAPSDFGVSSGYGATEGFRSSPHKGIDFRTPEGSSIQLQNGATYAGTFTDPNGGGTVVRINTPQGVMSLLHLTPGSVNPEYGSEDPPQSVQAANADNRKVSDDGVNNKEGTFNGNEDPIGSGSACAGNSNGSPMSLSEAKALSVAQNREMDSKGMTIASNNGVMDEASFKSYAAERMKCSPLLSANLNPSEAAKYGVSNTKDPNQWADFMWRLALAEQGGKVAASGADTVNDPGGSWGAWSTSVNDTSVYAGYSGMGVNDLQSRPELAANTAISMAESQIIRNNSIDGLDHAVTSQGSFAGTTMARMRGEGAPLTAASSGALVQRTTNQGMNAYGSANMSRYGAPVGVFSLPAVGSKVWVMFEGGSSQRPIYIGQVYEPANIRANG